MQITTRGSGESSGEPPIKPHRQATNRQHAFLCVAKKTKLLFKNSAQSPALSLSTSCECDICNASEPFIALYLLAVNQ